MDISKLTQKEVSNFVDQLTDDQIAPLAQAMAPAWSSGTRINDVPKVDEDGFSTKKADAEYTLSCIQQECWNKYNENPQISSHVIDIQGALTGEGFNIYSDITKIQEVLTEIEDDIRNELKLKYPKYVGRTEIEGELFLALTVHKDGFVEVDFMDPSALVGGDNNSGIYFHPVKKTMPLFYEFSINKGTANIKDSIIIPSIYLAHMPDLEKVFKATTPANFQLAKLKGSKTGAVKFKSIGGYKRFIVSWDRSLFMKRNVSHIKTTLEWINHYENLKKWEIDHKKSAGSYLWVFKMTDAKAFRTWLKMTDQERLESGITAQKTPGGSIILPPGIDLDVKNPSLPTISEQDNDIMHMVTSGLNKPEDMVTGQTKGDTFSGVKASRGPQADRIGDMICNFERFLRYNFWRSIFFLKHKVVGFQLEYKVMRAVSFENQKPKFKKIVVQAHDLIEFEFPQSEIADISNKAGALLGSKHPNVVDFLGISRAQVAKRLGFSAYRTSRLKHATEDELYPELASAALIEGGQEAAQEDSSSPNTDDPKKEKTPKKEKVKIKKPVNPPKKK